MGFRRCIIVVSAALGLVGCGSDSGSGSGNQTCTPGPTASVAITATGITPTNVCVSPGGRVTFSNNDSASTHDIEFETSGCPTVGDISAGGQFTATFTTQANCTFHDGRNAANANFRGTVAVTAVQVSGGGY